MIEQLRKRAIAQASARAAVWPLLRRTRYRLVEALSANPLDADALDPVIDALAAAEATLIGRDSELKPRRGRGPRTDAVQGGPDATLRARIRELEHELRVREEHVAIVAHDLRIPLSPVLLIVHRLLEEVRTRIDEALPARALLPRVESVAHRLHQLVDRLNRLLDATRLQTGHLMLEPEDIDLVAVVDAAVAEVAGDAGDRVVINVHADAPAIGHWDRTRVEQIVRNLLTNAIRYGAMQPIDVAIDRTGDHARLVVRDRGLGIDPADHDRIFERYTRASRSGTGLGLGLWIVRELCQAMGGSVALESSLGRGATFTVQLPLRPPPPSPVP